MLKIAGNKVGNKRRCCSIVAVVFLFIFLSIGVSSSSVVYATTSTLNLTLSSNTLSLNLRPSSSDGTFASSSDLGISVNTNNFTGYTLKIAASTNDDRTLSDKTNNSNSSSFASITSATTSTVFSGNTAESIGYNNKWGYLPSRLCTTTDNNGTSSTTCDSNTSYLPAPTTLGDTVDITSAKTSSLPAGDNEYTINIGARANTSTKASTYEGAFVITAIANAIPYTIAFNPNTNDTVNNMPGTPTTVTSGNTSSISDSTYAETITLPNTIPTRSGYDFLGWCSTNPTMVSSQNAYTDTCSGTTYNPNGGGTNLTYTLNQTTSNTDIALYAMWESNLLYGTVAAEVKTYNNNGQPLTQTAADLQATITTPTSNNPATDSSNSGVFLYNASVFGTASDASNDYNIYYYRGILDSSFDSSDSYGNIGSSGNGAYYPNYVRLGNTCWRIVRTTGSGGTKMIYNGIWVNNTCASAMADAGIANLSFGLQGNSIGQDWTKNINRVGYTFNNDTTIQDSTSSISVDTVFGSNSNYSTVNAANSNIKNYIENTWFTSAIGSYKSALEPSAGYCNDRTIYSNASSSPNLLSNVSPYATSNADIYFGAYERNIVQGMKLTLSCPRGVVDIYTTSSGIDGNGQLNEPVALITADEIALAGSGRSSTTVGYSSINAPAAYLRTGLRYWSLTPYRRNSDGLTRNFGGYLDGSLNGFVVDYGIGSARPVVSLKHSIAVSSGSGTAVDPWIINAP